MNNTIYFLNAIEKNKCPLIDKCSESDYGDEEICYEDYESCKNFQEREKRGIEEILK